MYVLVVVVFFFVSFFDDSVGCCWAPNPSMEATTNFISSVSYNGIIVLACTLIAYSILPRSTSSCPQIQVDVILLSDVTMQASQSLTDDHQ